MVVFSLYLKADKHEGVSMVEPSRKAKSKSPQKFWIIIISLVVITIMTFVAVIFVNRQKVQQITKDASSFESKINIAFNANEISEYNLP